MNMMNVVLRYLFKTELVLMCIVHLNHESLEPMIPSPFLETLSLCVCFGGRRQ